MNAGAENTSTLDSDARDQFIPLRKSDILDALAEHGRFASADARDKFRQICRLLAAVYHYEYFDRLEHLRHAYYYFNPEFDVRGRFEQQVLESAYAELIDSFVAVLKGANFVEVSHEEIERAHRETAEVRVELHCPLDDFRDVRFFRRGHHQEAIEVSSWWGVRKQTIDAMVYDDVVLLVAMNPVPGTKPERGRPGKNTVRPGSVLIKYFRNIASADLNALFPNVRVIMSMLDKIFLAVPAIFGGIPILFKLWSSITVLFLVIGFYMGVSAAAVKDEHWAGAIAAMTGLIALGGFMIRQWTKYQRQSLMYQKQLTDNIYFRNINNNAGIFDYIIGAAEEQECKEAFLAYYFLQTAGSPPMQTDLDRQIETWLKDKFQLDIDFEVEDALGKLERLGLLRRNGERLSVPPPDEALARLDTVWDDYFQYNAAAKAGAQHVPTSS
jgi:hypothetical protein